jgi:hypothetical protein
MWIHILWIKLASKLFAQLKKLISTRVRNIFCKVLTSYFNFKYFLKISSNSCLFYD